MYSLISFKNTLALVCLVFLVSCSNENDPPKTDAEIIGSGKAWKLSSATANGASIISLIKACMQDNLVTFNYGTPISIGVLDAGTDKCEVDEPQTVDFNWDYNESTKILSVDTEIIEVPGSQGDLKVESVTSTELVLSQNILYSGLTQKVILTLIH